jgi:hypothetical protein
VHATGKGDYQGAICWSSSQKSPRKPLKRPPTDCAFDLQLEHKPFLRDNRAYAPINLSYTAYILEA